MPTKDPEKLAAKRRRYWEKNREELNRKRREWAATEEGKRVTAERNAAYRAKEQEARARGDRWAIDQEPGDPQ